MSKLARALVLGAMLAAMNLAGMTAVAQAQANDEWQGRPGRPPKAKWGSLAQASGDLISSRPPRTPPSSGSWPESASPSPAGRPPRCPPRRSSRT